MYTCPKCGDYLHFDIKSQNLKCESCSSLFKVPPSSLTNTKTYNSKIYTCPQCGAELISESNQAITYCSFCGSTNILTEKIAAIEKPQKIIPFKITEKQCKEIYEDKIKSCLFVPNDMKNFSKINKFKGIYMPFYMSEAEFLYPFKVQCRTSEKKRIIEFVCEGHGKLQNIPHDASRSFNDDTSEAIVPFNNSELEDFKEGYMAGFYANTADVNSTGYDTEEIVDNYTKKYLSEKIGRSVDRVYANPKIEKSYLAYMPVWFSSYKNKDRISFAAINGQTGRVKADVPISISKYLMFAVVMAAIIFGIAFTTTNGFSGGFFAKMSMSSLGILISVVSFPLVIALNPIARSVHKNLLVTVLLSAVCSSFAFIETRFEVTVPSIYQIITYCIVMLLGIITSLDIIAKYNKLTSTDTCEIGVKK